MIIKHLHASVRTVDQKKIGPGTRLSSVSLSGSSLSTKFDIWPDNSGSCFTVRSFSSSLYFSTWPRQSESFQIYVIGLPRPHQRLLKQTARPHYCSFTYARSQEVATGGKLRLVRFYTTSVEIERCENGRLVFYHCVDLNLQLSLADEALCCVS